MISSTARVAVVRFGIFEADFRAGELRKAGLKVKLHDQPFQVLAMLSSAKIKSELCRSSFEPVFMMEST